MFLFLPTYHRYMNMRSFYIFCLSVCSLMLNACSKEYVSTASDNGKVQVSIGQSLKINTRTSIADDGTTAIWSGGDKIAVWAAASDGIYALEGEVFTMWHYNDALSSAIFTATITPMPDGVYTYYATYPEPKSTEGTTAVYELPQTQSASMFNGACDIMVARPVENAGALTDAKVNEMDFSFSHKMHTLKVNIPQGGNMLGMPITRLEFTFPTNVTGDVAVDITDPLAPAVLTNGSNKLVLEIPEGANEGESVWGMIFPTDISGEITYTAYSGGYASFPRTITVAKNAEAAHITPMSLPIPELYRLTEISLSIGENNLGEDVQSVSIINENGNVIKTLPVNAENEYILSYEGEFDAAQFSGKQFTARFESEHAIVEQPFTMPTITPYIKNTVDSIEVPYLLFENFDNLKTFATDGDSYAGTADNESNAKFRAGMLLDNYLPTTGWNIARGGGEANKCLRINVRYQSGAWIVARYCGRLDTPCISALKPEATNIKLKVEFDTGCYIPNGYNTDDRYSKSAYYIIGTHSNDSSSALNGISQDDISKNCDVKYTPVAEEYFESANPIITYDSQLKTYSHEIEGCNNTTRIVWFPCTTQTSKVAAANCAYYFYMDNIKVSIAKQ